MGQARPVSGSIAGGRLSGRLHDGGRAFTVIMSNPSLRRAELAFGASAIAEWMFTVGLGIVGVRGRRRPAARPRRRAAAHPSRRAGASHRPRFADRWPREYVLIASNLVLGCSTSAIGLVLAVDGPMPVVYGLAAAVEYCADALPSRPLGAAPVAVPDQ